MNKLGILGEINQENRIEQILKTIIQENIFEIEKRFKTTYLKDVAESITQ